MPLGSSRCLGHHLIDRSPGTRAVNDAWIEAFSNTLFQSTPRDAAHAAAAALAEGIDPRAYAISEDGALHAEKFYRTVTEEFQAARASYRWRYVVGLARVTASEFGRPAPGMDLAKSLLAV